MVPKLRFKEVSINKWETFSLGEIANFRRGSFPQPYGLPEWFDDNGYPFVQVFDVSDNMRLKDRTKSKISQLAANKSIFAPKGTLIMTIQGSIGRLALMQYDAYVDRTLLIFQSYKKNINVDFLKYSLFLLFNIEKKKADGGVIRTITKQTLTDFRIGIPSNEEQTKIADFLSSIEEKITLLNKQYDLLCQYKKGMMQKIFSQKMRFKNNNGGEFPEWETCKLKKFLIPTLREVKKPSENFLSIGIRSHFKGTFHKDNQDPNKVSVDKLFLVHEGDFILNITFAWEGALAIARKEDNLGYVSHRFPTYTFNKEFIISEFFRYIYTLPKFLTYLDLCSPGGAGRNRVLKKSEFLEIEIDRPCLAEQTKIANFFSALDDKIVVKKAELDTFRTWKQGLLQQMFV